MKKGLTLFLILVLPVLLYWLYVGFGKNHYVKLPIYGEKIPVETMVNGRTMVDTIYHQVGPFAFLDQDSVMQTERSFDGHFTVVNFMFTTCKSICIDMSKQMRRIQDSFSENPKVKMISMSVDPTTDIPSVLKTYGKENSANFSKWSFLTGNKDSLYSVIQSQFLSQVSTEPQADGQFIHSEKMLLIDSDRRIRGIFDGTNNREVDDLMGAIRLLKKEYENKDIASAVQNRKLSK